MFIDKPKRKRRQRKSFLRFFLIALIIIPAALFAFHPRVSDSLLADGIALSVMICAAVYIVHQAIVWLIAAYLGLLEDDSSEESVT